MTEMRTQNYEGAWVSSIPFPFYGLCKKCKCGRKFGIGRSEIGRIVRREVWQHVG